MATVLTRVGLRPVVPADRELLVTVYGAGRAAELDQVAWAPGQREAFVRMQYDAQDRQYRAGNPHGHFDVVEVDGQAAGRLYVDVRPADVRIVDIALLPAYRGLGIGRALLRRVLAEAAAGGRTASIHVEVHNPARRLYERLGFRPVEERGVHLLMEWSAEGGLVATRSDRHEQDHDAAEVVVHELDHALAHPVGSAEDQRELVPHVAAGTGTAEVRAEGRLDELEGRAAGTGGEGLADPAGEVVMGEPAHPPTVTIRSS